MLDVSASMGYGTGGMTKHEYSQSLAASLGYLMNRQRDRVGLTSFDEGIVTTLPPGARPGHLRAFLLTLDRMQLGRSTNLSKPLHQLADSLSKRGLVIVISDLLDEPGRVIRGLKHFQFRGTDVIVFQVLDPDEVNFPFERPTRFEDLETSEEIVAMPPVVRDYYLNAIGGLTERYRLELGACGVDYHLLTTDQPLEWALLAYLSARARKL
jgi:uncharacterized protein (DUF58 family)